MIQNQPFGVISTKVTGSFPSHVLPATQTATQQTVAQRNIADVILTPEQVAEWLSLSLEDVNALIRGGQLPSIYIKKNLYRLSMNKVLDWLENNSRNSKAEINDNDK